MSNREIAMKFALDILNEMDPTGKNAEIAQIELGALSDVEFGQLMELYASGKERLPIFAPVFGEVNLDVERNIAIGERLGYNFFQQIVYHSADADTPSFVGAPKYLVMEMPWRRTAQLLVEGISVAKHNNSTDQRTGAVTGASASSKMSGPEQGVLYAMNMKNAITELGSARGGDSGRWQAMEASFQRTGEASLAEISEFSTGPEAVTSLASLLTSMHIANSL